MPPQNLISCRNLSRSFTERPLFEGLTFGLFEGERTGLIGPNGAGKSTLLKILAGLDTQDQGEVSKRRGLKVRYLAQQDIFEKAAEGITVREELIKSLHGIGLEDYEIEMRVDDGILEARFNPDQRVDKLSGGWRKRLAILSQVLAEPDLLLLDEPTNHLDLEGVLWLEKFLLGLRFSFLIITHDRRFLEAVCTRVIELNKKYKEGHFSSVGNYSDFIENREAMFHIQNQQEESARNIVRREIEWLRRGPKARTTKQKARIDRAGELISELNELSIRNAQDRTANIDFSSNERRSKKLIEADHVTKSLGGRKLFGPLSLILSPGDKFGLLGGNGSGKSTLIKTLAGHIKPDSGVVKHAEDLKVVIFDQHREQLDLKMPLRRALCENGDRVQYKSSTIHVIGWAERFLFSKAQLDLPLSRLSGGEQSRVLIARLMLKPADVLFLDEPTNDLDMNSLEVLESSMLDFTGALVLVTHDRFLLDRVSSQLISLDGKGHARFFADLNQWEDAVSDEASKPSVNFEQPLQPVKEAKPSFTKEDAKELRNVEIQIQKHEQEVEKARTALEDPSIGANPIELLTRQITLEEWQKKLNQLYKRWEEIEAKR